MYTVSTGGPNPSAVLSSRSPHSASVGDEKIDAANDATVVVNDGMDQLTESNNLINRIAAQTHVLLMSAAIEAARAGDCGRGIAAVASEIRLAVTAGDNAMHVLATLKEIAQRLGTVSESNRESQPAFTQVEQEITEVAD
jgi:methyl-accepting chemotaxis protein